MCSIVILGRFFTVLLIARFNLGHLQVNVCRANFVIVIILRSGGLVHACLWSRCCHIIFNFILFSLFDIFEKTSFALNRT